MAAKQTYTVAVNAETKGAVRGLNNMNTALKGFIGLVAAREILEFGKNIKNTASEFQNYNNKLKLITTGQKDLSNTFTKLAGLAVETRTSFGDIVDLYSKLKISTEALGKSTESVTTVTANLSKALQLAGADGNTASSVIRQFGQAMASGEVRGDEFRSLVEGMGPALSIMARETGISVGELRKMSQSGQLTAEVMFDMIENSTALKAAFDQTVPTIGQLETALGDAFDRASVQIANNLGALDLYEKSIFKLTRALDRLSGIESALVNIKEPGDIFKGVIDGSINAVKALTELEIRLEQGLLLGGGSGRMTFAQSQAAGQVDAIKKLIPQIKEIIKAQKEKAEATKKSIEEEVNQTQVMTELLGPAMNKHIKLARDLKLTDITSPFFKLNRSLRQQESLVNDLTVAQNLLDTEIVVQNELYKELDTLIAKVNQEKATTIHLIDVETKAMAKEAKDAKDQADKIAANLEREIMLMSEFDKEQQALNDINEEARALRVEITDAIDDQIKKQQLLKQVEINRIEKVDALEEEAAKNKRERDQADIENFFSVNKKNFEVLGKYSKMAFQLNKALAIAEALMGAKQAALNAFAFTMKVFPPLAPVAMAASYAATAATVAGIASQQYAGRAGGGPVQKGQPYIVGEAGSEMFVPSQNGTIVSNSDMKGQGVTVNFNIDATDAEGFDELLVTRKNLIVSMVRQAVGQGRLA